MRSVTSAGIPWHARRRPAGTLGTVPNLRSHQSARSYLYVPGDQRDRLGKATSRGADALIVDLEDAVAVDRKAAARRTVAEWLSGQGERRCQIWVRVDAENLADDLDAVVGPNVDGIVLPKAEPPLARTLDGLLTDLERRRGLARPLAVIGLVETARGVLAAADLAAAPRVCRLGIGEVDLAAELRMRPGPDRYELTSVRTQIVLASAAAGIGAPVAPTSTDFRDLASLRASTEALLRLGFRGRTAIHPAQIPVINDVFTPTPEEIERARRLVAAYEAAQGAGAGAFVGEDGRMVDLAVVRSAREVLDLAGTRQTGGGDG